MTRKLLFLFVLFFSVGLTGCKKDDDTVDATQHDNWVYLESYMWQASISFNLADHSITGGQPWGGVTTGTPDMDWGIDAKAGRKGSTGPAEWFKAHASNATYTSGGSGAWPSELNFAYTGTITIDGNSYTIVIGQGNSFGRNNWWVGGPGWTVHPGVYANVVTPDGKYFFMPVDNSSDEFWIKTSYE